MRTFTTTLIKQIGCKSYYFATQFDVYNLHLTGGSYGKPKGVLKQRRQMRQGQLAALSKNCLKSSVSEVIIKGYIFSYLLF